MARGKTVDVAAILGGQLAKVSDSDTPSAGEIAEIPEGEEGELPF